MARITVEDCIDKFPSRFELVLVASNRARKLYSGETPTVEIDNDKNTVIALREIAEETITTEQLKNDLIQEYQTNTFSEDEELDEIEDSSDESEAIVNELQADQIDKNEDDASNLTEDSDNNKAEQDNSENSSDDEKI
tara:strand:- start:200 stop:613 length:414 start_codon:yes stop_codon:yes gene_type:complete